MARTRVVSLFCGCGGMDYGLIGGFNYLNTFYPELPFEIVYALDNNPYCARIYNDNFKQPCVVKDVKDLENKDLPEFDLLIGGFPCQSFSISAQNPPRLGYKDDKGMLFFEMVKVLRIKKPKFFIAENVKGLLSANNGNAFPMIINEFEKAGYYIKYKLFNTSDYGVPQKRERILILGFRDIVDFFKYSFPQPTTSTTKIPLSSVIDSNEDKEGKWYFSDKAVKGMLLVKDKMNKGRVQNINEPCNTISSHLAKISLNSTDPVLKIGNKFRRFTPREAARIQSFPENFKFSAVSDTHKYIAIGNAVPPVFMWHIAHSLAKII